jgi:hypothetical protein
MEEECKYTHLGKRQISVERNFVTPKASQQTIAGMISYSMI